MRRTVGMSQGFTSRARVFPVEAITEVRVGGDMTSWESTEKKELKNVYSKTKPKTTPGKP